MSSRPDRPLIGPQIPELERLSRQLGKPDREFRPQARSVASESQARARWQVEGPVPAGVNPVRNGNSIDEGAILEAVQPYARHFQIPEDVAFEVANMAAREDIPLEIAFRLVERESSFDPGARVRRTGAGGYTQMTPIALHELQRVGKADPELTYPELVSDPRLNLEHGFRYLRHMLDRFQGDWSKALDHYSGGAEGYADKVQGMPK